MSDECGAQHPDLPIRCEAGFWHTTPHRGYLPDPDRPGWPSTVTWPRVTPTSQRVKVRFGSY